MLTIDGEELILSRQDEGLGLLALMNGSEGLLGIVTEVTVKLTPIPLRPFHKLSRSFSLSDTFNDDAPDKTFNTLSSSACTCALVKKLMS
jgi:FAD/FMN-containing dehydrogenase